MQTVNIHVAGTQLSRLIDDAAAGDEIVIERAGQPVARLVAVGHPEPGRKRLLGALAGSLHVPANFDAPLSADELDRFDKS